MVKKKATPRPKITKSNPRKARKDNSDIVIGLLLLLLTAFITISLASFKGAAIADDPMNWGGILGFLLARFLFAWLGVIAYLLPFLLVLWGFNRLLRRPGKKLFLNTLTLLGLGFFTQVTLGYFHKVALFPVKNNAGVITQSMNLAGRFGTMVFAYLANLVGRLGLGFILGFLLLVSLVLIFDINLHKLLTKALERSKAAAEERREQRAALLAEREKAVAEQATEEDSRITETRQETDVPATEKETKTAETPVQKGITPRIIYSSVMDVSQEELKLAELLDSTTEDLTRPPDRETREGAKLLINKLKEFGVAGTVGDIIPGPVITRYEFHPAPGVKISKITGLADDLSLSLKADRIRILPIPGKSAVGIEIPNKNRKTVGLRLIVRSKNFIESTGPLTIALGATITGTPQVADLASVPHLLIAGTTGSGKSVCIHSILTSMLIKSGPRDVRFILIDPKRLELPAYNPIPHLIQPAIVDPRKAASSLEFVVKIMEERYKEFSMVGARDIAGYNLKARDTKKKEKPYIVVVVDELADLMLTAPGEVEQRIIRLAQMARAVGIHLILATQRPSVDVITGLIKANFPGRIAFQVASKTDSRTILDMNGAEALLGRGDMLFLPPGKGEPERLHGSFVSTGEVNRIVQKLATARLKALLSTQVDEQKAQEFAEGIVAADLLDPLLDPAEPLYETKRQKLSEMISPELVQALQGQYYPKLEELIPIREQMTHQTKLDSVDEFFAEAARLVMRHKEASVSMLQRRLNVGWARAGRIIDQMEQAGIVGAYEGSKSRKVLLGDEAALEKILKEVQQG
jgi:S-DNA-T family DNA segregation ATPase FtsK/SpoIIIE